jgi:hypothetical protein
VQSGVAVVEKKGLVPVLGACSIRMVALALIVELRPMPLT